MYWLYIPWVLSSEVVETTGLALYLKSPASVFRHRPILKPVVWYRGLL